MSTDYASAVRKLNNIICVDDDQAILNQLEAQLEEAFGAICNVECAESAEEALGLMEDIEQEGGRIRIVISDQVMPGMKGDRFLEQVNQQFPMTQKILLTGYAGLESAMYAINYAGLDKYIEKPWDKQAFLSTVEQLLESPMLINPEYNEFRVRDAIRNVLIFRDLSAEEVELIEEKLQLVKFPKDTVIFNIDDPGDCMYIIKSGEVKVVAGMGTEGETLAYLTRGNYFGEMALLTGEPRSASIVTEMETELFSLSKKDFDFLLNKHPSIALTLSHVLSQRLRDVSIKRAGRQNKIICVLNAIQQAHEKAIVVTIARKLMEETNGKVVIIDLDSSEAQVTSMLQLERRPTGARWIIENLSEVQEDQVTRILPKDSSGVQFFLPPSRDDESLSAYIIQLLSIFKEYYNFVLVNFTATCEVGSSVVKTMEQASTIVYLFEQAQLVGQKSCVLLETLQQQFTPLMAKLQVVAIREKDTPSTASTLLYNLVERHQIHYLRLDADPVESLFQQPAATSPATPPQKRFQITQDASRIARRLGNLSVGLVLGGGGARAYAHLGVLKVLEEENIPVDMLAGTSMGAFIGALYILGKSTDDILRLSWESWKKLNSPLSWTLPRVAFIKEKRIRQMVHAMFGDVLIEDLPVPFFCVAGDLVSGQEVVMTHGKLYEAILATGALPAFFPPVNINNMQLVDGGVVNNVPGDVLRKHGINVVIAVDVTPQREVHLSPIQDFAAGSIRGHWLRRLLEYGKYLKSRYGTILLPRIIMRVIAIEGLEITRNKSSDFDVHIRPNLENFDLFDFRKLPDIVKIGEQAGRLEIAKIRDCINALKR